jgi:hypothetical protein
MPKRGLPKTYYRIREWMLYDGPAERPSAPRLWDEDRLVYERLIQLRTLLFQKAHDYHDAMKVMMRTYGISEITFNRDYRGLTYIFGDLEEESKEFERARLKAIGWKIMQDCLAKGDNKTATSMHKNLIALGGHDREDTDPIDPERLDPGMYALVLDAEVRELFMRSLASAGSLDVSKLMDGLAEDAEVVENGKEDGEEERNP